MVLLLPRTFFARWICHQFVNQRAAFHNHTTAANRNEVRQAVCCSRSQSFDSGHLFWISRVNQFGTFRNNPRQRYHVVGTVLGTLGFIAGCVAYVQCKASSSTVYASVSDDDDVPPEGVTAKLKPTQRFNFVADVVDKAAPSVVYIELLDRHPFSGRMSPVSNGSGFVVRADGLIVTNAHVVANKAKVKVRLYDGREMEGWVAAVDPVSDLAAVKINATGLQALRMGVSGKLRAGEWVIAMGSPLSLSNTVTCGIVSSVNRRSKELGMKNKDMEYIQTDALINFGNSGGPLINLDGEVIGINSMKVTAGISFAIPSDYASNFLSKVDEVLERGKPKTRQWFHMGTDTGRRRFIGITMLTLNSQLLVELKSRVPDFPEITGGVLVHKIVIGSPAFSSGLQAGDIITEINEQPVQSSADVYRLVETTETLNIVAFRGKEKINVKVISEEVR